MKKILKDSALLLLLFLCIMITFTTVLYFFNITISVFHLPISFIISFIIYYFINGKKIEKKNLLLVLLTSVIVLFSSILISSLTYDRSSDGNTYHKDAIGVLKEGFNPVKNSSKDFIIERDHDNKLTNYSIWTDHYAKANWIMGANFYKLTGNIESGKTMNFISIFIVFSLIFTYLVEKIKFSNALIIALLTVINPITSAQMFTYYNDMLVCLYLFLSIFMLIRLDKDIKDKEAWIIYILSFVILSNLKFNGLGYLLVFSFLFVCKYLYKSFKEKEFINLFKKLCLIFIPLFLVSLVIVGYPTYIKNTIDHNNPFFPLYDKNGEDIITAQEPKSFLKMNNLEKLYYGTFSKANNLRENDDTKIKLPFMVYKDELVPATSVDLRISGWGILFSGLLIISIGILIIKYNSYKEENYLLYSLGITLLLLIVMSESWWARYTPHFYLFILVSLYILLKYSKKNYLKYFYILLITANTLVPLLGNTYYTLTNSLKIRKDLHSLKNKSIVLENNPYNGILYNLKDNNIKYKFTNKIESNKELYYHYLNYEEK